MCGLDSAKPGVDLEDTGRIQRLMLLFHGPLGLAGGPAAGSSALGQGLGGDSQAAPASTPRE